MCILFYLCVWMCLLCVCMCNTCVPGAHRSLKKVSDLLGPELQRVVSHSVVAGN
jgi:amino acid permease